MADRIPWIELNEAFPRGIRRLLDDDRIDITQGSDNQDDRPESSDVPPPFMGNPYLFMHVRDFLPRIRDEKDRNDLISVIRATGIRYLAEFTFNNWWRLERKGVVRISEKSSLWGSAIADLLLKVLSPFGLAPYGDITDEKFGVTYRNEHGHASREETSVVRTHGTDAERLAHLKALYADSVTRYPQQQTMPTYKKGHTMPESRINPPGMSNPLVFTRLIDFMNQSFQPGETKTRIGGGLFNANLMYVGELVCNSEEILRQSGFFESHEITEINRALYSNGFPVIPKTTSFSSSKNRLTLRKGLETPFSGSGQVIGFNGGYVERMARMDTLYNPEVTLDFKFPGMPKPSKTADWSTTVWNELGKAQKRNVASQATALWQKYLADSLRNELPYALSFDLTFEPVFGDDRSKFIWDSASPIFRENLLDTKPCGTLTTLFNDLVDGRMRNADYVFSAPKKKKRAENAVVPSTSDENFNASALEPALAGKQDPNALKYDLNVTITPKEGLTTLFWEKMCSPRFRACAEQALKERFVFEVRSYTTSNPLNFTIA